jgi:hypothetical protein
MWDNSSPPNLVDFIQEKVSVFHDNVPPGAAHLLGDAPNMSFEPLIPFIVPPPENNLLDS